MAHANAIFLSLVSSAALVLGLTPGCSNSTTPAPAAAIVWQVTPGTNSPTVCGAGGGVTWTVGNPEGHPIQTVSNGGSSSGVPVSVQCQVTATSTGFNVTAQATYGNEGSLTLNGPITVTPGESTPAAQTGITATFSSGGSLDFTQSLSSNNCTVTFNKNSQMGIAASRIWGYIDCPAAVGSDKTTTCDANAEFLFEYCEQ